MPREPTEAEAEDLKESAALTSTARRSLMLRLWSARQAKCRMGTEYTALVALGRGGKTSGLLGSAAVLQIGLGHAQFAA